MLGGESYTSDVDLDDFKAVGTYHISKDTDAAKVTNSPTNSSGALYVIGPLGGTAKNTDGTTYVVQLYMSHTGNIWTREWDGWAKRWGSWKRYITDDYLVINTGTSSTTYGTLTYAKFGSGWAVVTGNLTLTISSAFYSFGNLYASEIFTVSLPFAFDTSAMWAYAATSVQNSPFTNFTDRPSGSSVRFRLFAAGAYSSGGTTTANLMVFGKYA
jgi:hypothetical protein